MIEVKSFKIEQKFISTADLYKYLPKNVDLISELTGVQIQKTLKIQPFCITGKEKITERNILFFVSESEFLESLGELIILAGAIDADIIVFFMSKISINHLEPIEWLQKICNDDIQFIIGEVQF